MYISICITLSMGAAMVVPVMLLLSSSPSTCRGELRTRQIRCGDKPRRRKESKELICRDGLSRWSWSPLKLHLIRWWMRKARNKRRERDHQRFVVHHHLQRDLFHQSTPSVNRTMKQRRWEKPPRKVHHCWVTTTAEPPSPPSESLVHRVVEKVLRRTLLLVVRENIMLFWLFDQVNQNLCWD